MRKSWMVILAAAVVAAIVTGCGSASSGGGSSSGDKGGSPNERHAVHVFQQDQQVFMDIRFAQTGERLVELVEGGSVVSVPKAEVGEAVVNTTCAGWRVAGGVGISVPFDQTGVVRMEVFPEDEGLISVTLPDGSRHPFINITATDISGDGIQAFIDRSSGLIRWGKPFGEALTCPSGAGGGAAPPGGDEPLATPHALTFSSGGVNVDLSNEGGVVRGLVTSSGIRNVAEDLVGSVVWNSQETGYRTFGVGGLAVDYDLLGGSTAIPAPAPGTCGYVSVVLTDGTEAFLLPDDVVVSSADGVPVHRSANGELVSYGMPDPPVCE